MTTAILDTNVFVQATFSPPQSASYRTIVAHEKGRFQLIFSTDKALADHSMPQSLDRTTDLH